MPPDPLKFYTLYTIICAYINTCAKLHRVDSLLLLAVPVNKSLLRAWKYTLIDTSVPRPKKPCITNWNLCVLCQEDTTATLECPAKSKRTVVGSGYKSLAKHLI